MAGSKFNSVLCLIIILNAFGSYCNALGVVSNTLQAASTVVEKCSAPIEVATPFQDGMTAQDLLPHSPDVWTTLKDVLDTSDLLGPDFRSVPQMINDDGYPVQNHTITTDDGYILTYYRIPCGKANNCSATSRRPPVLVQHGFLTFSGSWIAVADKDCLPYILADAGYDVWLGNARGTTPSQGHTNASITSAQYWSFDWEQMGTKDIPAAINYILKNTSFPQLYYVGHSMGTSMAFAGLSLKPEVSDKIKVFFALAPVAWLFETTTVLRLGAPAEIGLQGLSYQDILGKVPGQLNPALMNEILQAGLHTVCDPEILSSVVCGNAMFLVCGYDFTNTNFTAMSELMGHFTNTFSLNTLRHFYQSILWNHFRRFDYGLIENYNKYKQCTPPDYNVTAIRSKTVFFYGDSDAFSQIDDVMKLAGKMNQTLLTMHPMPIPHWNHLDFLVANNARQYIADPIISYMKQNPI